jgi:hypothetical protein
MQHLFFKCPSVNKIIKEIEAIFNRSGLTANIEIKELNIMLGLYGGEDLDVINLSGDIVVFDSFNNCSLSLIFRVTLRSGTIVVSPFKTIMNFSANKRQR